MCLCLCEPALLRASAKEPFPSNGHLHSLLPITGEFQLNAALHCCSIQMGLEAIDRGDCVTLFSVYKAAASARLL